MNEPARLQLVYAALHDFCQKIEHDNPEINLLKGEAADYYLMKLGFSGYGADYLYGEWLDHMEDDFKE